VVKATQVTAPATFSSDDPVLVTAEFAQDFVGMFGKLRAGQRSVELYGRGDPLTVHSEKENSAGSQATGADHGHLRAGHLAVPALAADLDDRLPDQPIPCVRPWESWPP